MMTNLEICEAFAAKHNIIFEPEGGCGIGRKCVGFLGKNGNWIDYNPIDMETYDPIKYLECEALEPPKGNPNNAVLKVIMRAKAFISSRVTKGAYLTPPFPGPRKVE